MLRLRMHTLVTCAGLATHTAAASASTSSMLQRPWFTHGSSLSRDRAQLLAEDQDAALVSGVFVPVTPAGESFTLISGDDAHSLLELRHADLPAAHLDVEEWAWIGCRPDGQHVFAVEMQEETGRAAVKVAGIEVDVSPLRNVADGIACPDDAAVLSTARGILHFHRTHQFCSSCGAATKAYKGGAARACTNRDSCGARVYPRVDPAAIMLVTSPAEVDGRTHALLGRKRAWPAGRFSTLSGFSECGESLEEAVIREVEEESGVRVRKSSLRFVVTQPWLFPQSLMVGFTAEAEPGQPSGGLPEVRYDKDELEDCRWFPRDYVRTRLVDHEGDGGISLVADTSGTPAEEFHIPGKVSLANLLITQWAHEVGPWSPETGGSNFESPS